jgi:hypothetical protein
MQEETPLEGMRDLPREIEPSRVLEERMVRTLAARGLVQSHRASVLASPWVGAAAAAVVVAVFTAGFALGRSNGGGTSHTASRPARDATSNVAQGTPSVDVAKNEKNPRDGNARYVVWF